MPGGRKNPKEEVIYGLVLIAMGAAILLYGLFGNPGDYCGRYSGYVCQPGDQSYPALGIFMGVIGGLQILLGELTWRREKRTAINNSTSRSIPRRIGLFGFFFVILGLSGILFGVIFIGALALGIMFLILATVDWIGETGRIHESWIAHLNSR